MLLLNPLVRLGVAGPGMTRVSSSPLVHLGAATRESVLSPDIAGGDMVIAWRLGILDTIRGGRGGLHVVLIVDVDVFRICDRTLLLGVDGMCLGGKGGAVDMIRLVLGVSG